MRKATDFWNFQISCRATVPSLNLFLQGAQMFFVFFPPLFLFPSLPLLLSPLPLAMFTAFPSLYLRYISCYLCTQSLWPFCCIFYSLSDNYNFKFKFSKRHSIMRFCMMLHHLPDVMYSWCIDIMSACYPPFDFDSYILFPKYHGCTVQRTRQLPSTSGVGLSYWHFLLYAIQKGEVAKEYPLLSQVGKSQQPSHHGPWRSDGMVWPQLCIPLLPMNHLTSPL